jgi:uncharacterized protein YggE
MMKWIMGLGFGLAAAPVLAAPVDGARLHIEAVGEVAPDSAAYNVRLEAAGAKALAAQQEELSASLAKLGAEVSFAPAPIEAEARVKGVRPAVGASSVMRVTLRDLALQDKVEAAIAGGSGFALTQGMRLFVADPAKAHRAAVAQALAKARAEGEAYAAALGWRITGIAGVSNAKPGLSAADLIGTLARVDGAGRAGRAEVLAGTSYAAVAVDFIVAQ